MDAHSTSIHHPMHASFTVVVVLVFCSYEQVLDINAQTPGCQERRSDGALTDILSWDIAEVVSPCLPRGL